MADNIEKAPPKGKIKFNITLSDEQKEAKSNILIHLIKTKKSDIERGMKVKKVLSKLYYK